MSKFTSLIRRAPKRLTAAVAMLAAVVIVPALGHAWGPDRPTYTIDHPADHITFNSITDNPVVGDERNFVVAKDASNTSDGGWSDNVTVQPGKEYVIRVYVHNDAATSLNLTATNTRVSAAVATTTGTDVPVSGFVSADNSAQPKIWDDVHFKSAQNFNLAYVPGSAQIFNNGYAQSGASLPDSIVTSAGALIGYNGPDGKVPGCFQYANYVYFKVKPQFAASNNFTLSKMVSKHGANSWTKNYTAQPGELVDYILAYKNTGQVQDDSVTFRDTLPAGISYVPGSGTWSNASTQNVKFANDANLTNGTGINVGSYAPGANAWVIFTAKVASEDQLQCGVNTLTNTGKVNTGGYAVEDTANVSVTRTCVPPKQITVCRLSDKTIVTINESDFDSSKYSKNLNDCNIQVCRLSDKTIVTIKASDFDSSKYSKTLSDCNTPTKIVVCRLADKQVVTINESDFDSSKYSKDTSACAPVTPPTTPTQLPTTGAGDGIVASIGLGSLIASASYYVASRRGLNR